MCSADMNGRATVRIMVGPGYPGNYSVIIVVVGSSITTRLVSFYAVPPAAKTISILQQPSAGAQPAALVGNLLPIQPSVRVTDANGVGIANVIVLTRFVNDDCSDAPAAMDISNPVRHDLRRICSSYLV